MAEGGSWGNNGPQRPRFPIIANEVVTISEKVFFPVTEYPGYNFVGKLLGPKGSNLKALVQSTRSKISILGKGSSKDKSKEEELCKSEDQEHAHFKEELHVLVSVKAPKIAAHRRLSQALKELNHYMIPQPDERIEHQEERPFVNDSVAADRSAIYRIGIPPSGAVMHDEAPRGGGRSIGREPLPRDPYPVDNYDNRNSDRYAEHREPVRYPDDRDSFRHTDKRISATSNGYSPKRFREEKYDPYAR